MPELSPHTQEFVDFFLHRIGNGATVRYEKNDNYYCCGYEDVSDLRIYLDPPEESEEVFNAILAHLCDAYRETHAAAEAIRRYRDAL